MNFYITKSHKSKAIITYFAGGEVGRQVTQQSVENSFRILRCYLKTFLALGLVDARL